MLVELPPNCFLPKQVCREPKNLGNTKLEGGEQLYYTVSHTKGQFHQCPYAQILHQQIPKVQKDSQVISRKKFDQLVELLYFGRFVLCTQN